MRALGNRAQALDDRQSVATRHREDGLGQLFGPRGSGKFGNSRIGQGAQIDGHRSGSQLRKRFLSLLHA
jgi:hypothetical protein